MINSDFHVHTYFSSDSNASMESLISHAIAIGLKRICFTDHQDFEYPSLELPFTFDTDAFFEEFNAMKEKYRKQIEVLAGVELGVQPYLAERYRYYLSVYNFDFIIASSHLLKKEDPYLSDFWVGKDSDMVYRQYFEEISDNIKYFNDFNVYGHLDYIVRYGPNKNQDYTYKKYSESIDEALISIIHAGKGIEINTSGFRYNLGYAHPQTDVLKRYRELGGEIITVGSDAHSPEHLVYEFDKARDILKEIGFRYYTIFKGKKPIFEAL